MQKYFTNKKGRTNYYMCTADSKMEIDDYIVQSIDDNIYN